MGLLELVQKHVTMRKVSSEWHGPCPECGTSQSDPAFSDRFTVKADGRWFCRNCGNGDAVAFLRRFEQMSCPDAHAAAGKVCTSTSCSVTDKCRMGNGAAPPKKNHYATPDAGTLLKPSASFTPGDATTPVETWQHKAEAVVTASHEALLTCPEQLAYLAERGLPHEAVVKYRLGWNAAVIWRPRASWGLPEKINQETGKPKKLWVPRGIVIPTYIAGVIHRVRVRVPKEDRSEKVPPYVAVSGSGDDVAVLNPAVRGFVVVEADLDAILIDWLVGDIVGAIPLVSCDVKPKSTAAALLDNALSILVATDYEPRDNAKTGVYENPGGKAARWWLKNYPRAKRWPVPVGKDPGDALAAGVDLRGWVLAGLPPAMTLPTRGVPYLEPAYRLLAGEPQAAVPLFDQAKAQRMISDTSSLISSRCPRGAMNWIATSRPDVFAQLNQAGKAVDSTYQSENQAELVKCLSAWQRYHDRAFELFEARPPIIDVHNELFQQFQEES